MHSVLSTFFTGPVSGEEKKRRLTQRVQCVFFFFSLFRVFFLFFFSLFASFSVDFDNSHEHFLSRDQQDGPDAVCVDGGTDDRE